MSDENIAIALAICKLCSCRVDGSSLGAGFTSADIEHIFFCYALHVINYDCFLFLCYFCSSNYCKNVFCAINYRYIYYLNFVSMLILLYMYVLPASSLQLYRPEFGQGIELHLAESSEPPRQKDGYNGGVYTLEVLFHLSILLVYIICCNIFCRYFDMGKSLLPPDEGI